MNIYNVKIKESRNNSTLLSSIIFSHLSCKNTKEEH